MIIKQIIIKSLTFCQLKEAFENKRQLYNDEFEYFRKNLHGLFTMACRLGNLEIVEWLYNLSRSEKEAIGKLECMLHKNKSDENPTKRIRLDYDFEKIKLTNSDFRLCCFDGHLDIVKWLYEQSKRDGNTKININDLYDKAFVYACEGGHLELAKWLFELSKTDGNTQIGINTDNQRAFSESCSRGYLEMSKWLYETSKANNCKIDINQYDGHDFRYCCYHGNLETAKWLLDLSNKDENTPINIRAKDDFAFKNSCYYYNIDVALWLCTLCPEYSVQIVDVTYLDLTNGQTSKKTEKKIIYYKIGDVKYCDFCSKYDWTFYEYNT